MGIGPKPNTSGCVMEEIGWLRGLARCVGLGYLEFLKGWSQVGGSEVTEVPVEHRLCGDRQRLQNLTGHVDPQWGPFTCTA